ncbi:MAG TPA: integrase arm-type DNA-binding domain-containing protein [Vicinamibacterales bacterium]|nr:integrase arm-type DNA-binding domain-containing protein [Vicinamibacterales bacterium]
MREAQGHPQRALSARSVATAKSSRITRRVADGGGLYLVVAPSGSKSWVLRTVVKGRRCDIGLGSATLVSLAEARDEATRLRKIARAGGDPLSERRRERRTVPSFEAAARQVHASHSAAFKNDKHRKQWLSSLATVFLKFGSRTVDAITRADILSALGPTWLATPETSRRVLQRIRTVLEWSKAQGFYAGDNPADGLTQVLPKHRDARIHHASLPFAQVPDFIQSLHAANVSEMVKLAFELTILCATRTSETLNATWDEIDVEAKSWTIPGSRMKAGISHRVPLSTRAVAILERARELSDGGPYVFRGRALKKPLSNMVFLMALRRMNRSDLTAHGFRSSFRDWAAECTSSPRAVCEAALAHTLRDKTEAAYLRSDLFDLRRALMNAWADHASPVSPRSPSQHQAELPTFEVKNGPSPDARITAS